MKKSITLTICFYFFILYTKAHIPVAELNKCIERSANYYIKKSEKLDLYSYLLLYSINEEYKLKIPLDYAKYINQLKDTDYKEAYLYYRGFDSSFQIQQDCIDNIDTTMSMKALVLYALNYPKIKLPKDYFNSVFKFGTSGGYESPHALLAITLLKRNQWDSINNHILSNLEDTVATYNFNQYKQNKCINKDNELEVVSTLLTTRYADSIPESYYLNIIESQNKYGYWLPYSADFLQRIHIEKADLEIIRHHYSLFCFRCLLWYRKRYLNK